MIKHILVPTDGSDYAMLAVRYAAAFANQYGATLHGLHVVDVRLLEGPFLRDISASLGTAPYVNYQGNMAMILEERGKAALEALSNACRDAGIRCETSQVTGTLARSIVERGELTDLIVMGRGGEHGEWLEGGIGSTTQAVVRRATRPVLVTGTAQPGHDLYVVAYDGSSHSKRALQFAAQLCADWNAPLHVLSVGAERATASLDEARAYLDAHEMSVQYVQREGGPERADCGLCIGVRGGPTGNGSIRAHESAGIGRGQHHCVRHEPRAVPPAFD